MILLLLALSCAPKPVSPVENTPSLNTAAIRGTQDSSLQQLLSDHWEATLRRDPVFATRNGDHRYDSLIYDNSPEIIAANQVYDRLLLSLAQHMPPPASAADRQTLELFRNEMEGQVAQQQCHFEEWSLSPRMNALVSANDLVELLEIKTPEDGQHLLDRYRALPQMVDNEVALLRQGLAAGRVGNRASTQLVIDMLAAEQAKSLADLALMEPTRTEHPDWPPAALESFRTTMKQIVEQQIRPAFLRYQTFLTNELLPHTRGDAEAGLKYLPGGDACYAATIQYHTTLPKSAVELHQLGMDQLQSVHAEMRVLGKKLFGTEELSAIFAHLRNDPALHFADSSAVHAKAEEALSRAKAAIPRYFGRLPKNDCFVEDIPEYQAPYTTIAYYQPGVAGGDEPGRYFINTFAPTTRPIFEAEVLAWHESIPGHHLQIAIAQENQELPAFRQNLLSNAFVEGWALYTERLADEMGLYSSDLDRMGMLSFDSWRASRLAVDTGIHALGWSRSQAEAFMLENTPLAENNIKNEVDRYITWPGQALAYKVGQIEILALRKQAKEKLGDRFVLSRFHDVVLGSGAVSLPVLRRNVEAWVEAGG